MTSKQCPECDKIFKEPKAGPVLFFCSDECATKHSHYNPSRILKRMRQESLRWEDLPFEEAT